VLWAFVLLILGFLGLSVLELGRGTRVTRQTDRHTEYGRTDKQTDNAHHFIMSPPCGGLEHTGIMIKTITHLKLHGLKMIIDLSLKIIKTSSLKFDHWNITSADTLLRWRFFLDVVLAKSTQCSSAYMQTMLVIVRK